MKDELSAPLWIGVPFSSNAVRLSWREAIVAAGILVGLFALVPRLWERVERFEPGADFRVPYELGNDYWLYARTCRTVAPRYTTFVIGDSVVWGQYVARDETLPHYLNTLAGNASRFANMGLDGSHPLALEGLVAHYAGAIAGKNVILHYNPLWTTSSKHDLQFDKEFSFNHPRLVPQFRPWIQCYTAGTAERMGVVLEQNLTLFSWANHLRMTYFENKGLPTWTMERPYENPLKAITFQIPLSDKGAHSEAKPWTVRGMDRSDFPWVDLAGSLQWAAFTRCIGVLQGRGNKVFVVIGPFNEHMLVGKGVEAYARMKRGMQAWLDEKGVPCFLPPVLPSELYADASHPLAKGYEMLARQLYASEAFKRFDGR